MSKEKPGSQEDDEDGDGEADHNRQEVWALGEISIFWSCG